MEDDVYVVEKIVGSRKRNGVKQYLIKWESYPDSENTWEKEGNIFCKKLIREYEKSQKKIDKPSENEKKPRKKGHHKVSPRKRLSRAVTNEWDDLVEKVVSVSKDGDDKNFMVELLFKNGERGLLPVSQVHTKCPLHLLEYYEENLIFTEDSPTIE